MTVEVVSLHQPQDDVIAVLREVLARAERGEVRAVAIAVHQSPNETATIYAMGDGDMAHLNLAIDRIKLRLLDIE